ncbi:hypothetical protein DFQ11_10965 [Winogradskyella epiphytica]|uniref:Uncharacterized protein n=1 Tax=Winogradskyella epiphytica TaxID=262005 RepID=A0A2V4YAE7_9FLAO|nr:hypothetical protein DFQ11_10965 [Winogradskyella epiphytica]
MKYVWIPLLCIYLLSCNKITNNKTFKAKTCVEKVILRDQELGEIRNQASLKVSLSESIGTYTSHLMSLNYECCPETFQKEFKEHISAWINIKTVTDKYPELRGEMHDLFLLLENGRDAEEFKMLSKKIWQTWNSIQYNYKE